MGDGPEQIKEKLDIEFGRLAHSTSFVYKIVALIKRCNTNASFELRPGIGINTEPCENHSLPLTTMMYSLMMEKILRNVNTIIC